MSGQEGYPCAVKGADNILVRGLAEGRGHRQGSDLRQPFHVIQAAAADHADTDLFRLCRPSYHEVKFLRKGRERILLLINADGTLSVNPFFREYLRPNIF
jgi:hypothetical protein